MTNFPNLNCKEGLKGFNLFLGFIIASADVAVGSNAAFFGWDTMNIQYSLHY